MQFRLPPQTSDLLKCSPRVPSWELRGSGEGSQDALALLPEGDGVGGHGGDLWRVPRVQPPLQVHHADVLVLRAGPGGRAAGTRREDDLADGRGGGGGAGGVGRAHRRPLGRPLLVLQVGVVVQGGVAGRAVQVVALGRGPALLGATGQQAEAVFGTDGHAGHCRVLETAQTVGQTPLPGCHVLALLLVQLNQVGPVQLGEFRLLVLQGVVGRTLVGAHAGVG
ncbi:hypothetical protein UPYG_G00274870 [Umbra pygmaea]|uniref:Uncharacterized protein n=1 Tax=Umbra pygmaea TaxID=75934 RepID=A0ABD0W6R7_UMBPY